MIPTQIRYDPGIHRPASPYRRVCDIGVSVSRFFDHGESMTAVMSTWVRDRAAALFTPRIAVVAALLLAAPAPVLAAVQVSGNPKAVRIEAQNTSIADILAALGRDFGV